MTKPTIKIVNVETGEEIEREMTAEEIDPSLTWTDKEKEEANSLELAKAQKAADKAALLTKLGITDDEAKLLLS
jgi:hypothetical protein